MVGAQEPLTLLQQAPCQVLSTAPRQVYLRESQKRCAFQKAKEARVQIGIEAPVSFLKRRRDPIRTWGMTVLEG